MLEAGDKDHDGSFDFDEFFNFYMKVGQSTTFLQCTHPLQPPARGCQHTRHSRTSTEAVFLAPRCVQCLATPEAMEAYEAKVVMRYEGGKWKLKEAEVGANGH